jgi:hypothetical protein
VEEDGDWKVGDGEHDVCLAMRRWCFELLFASIRSSISMGHGNAYLGWIQWLVGPAE